MKPKKPIPAGKWAVKGENNSAGLKSQRQKVQIARKIARNKKSELVIHNKDGKISDKDSYGNDPFPERDKVK
ncbi:MAG: DUF2188 domain-containing protein [Ignavibacteria bacterium]|nr:DUF2188 domain-containing protein [Ignavibacteria bacterium]